MTDRLDEIKRKEAEIDQQLAQLINDASVFNKFKDLVSSVPLESFGIQVKTLESTVRTTFTVSRRISQHVKLLDKQQKKTRECLEYVEAIQDIKICANGLDKAIQDNDLFACVDFIKRIRQKNADELTAIFTRANLMPQNELNADIFAKIATQKRIVLNRILKEFDDATAQSKDALAKDLIKLFPVIGEEELGLDRFSAFLCSTLASYCKDCLKQRGNVNYSEIISRLYDMVANVITKQQQWIEQDFGPGFHLVIIERLQREAQLQFGLMLSSFVDSREIERKIHDIKRGDKDYTGNNVVSNVVSNAGNNNTMYELREIDSILSQIAITSHKAEYFDRFIQIQVHNQVKLLSTAQHETFKDSLNALCNIKRCSKLEDLMNSYLLLEDFYLSNSIQRAIKLDKVHSSNERISTSVDDVFFIMKKSAARAVSTSNVQCLCAVLNSVGRLLEEELMSDFQKRLSACFNVEAQQQQPGFVQQKPKLGFMILLNNMDTCCKYLDVLMSEINILINEKDQGILLDSFKIINATLNTLKDSQTTFFNVLKDWIENVFGQIIKPKAKKIVSDALKPLKYSLSESEYKNSAMETSEFTRYIMSNFQKIIQPYKINFTETNLHLLILNLTELIVKELEKHVFTCKFTLFGGLQFDRDLRMLVHYFIQSSSPQYALKIKEKFKKLEFYSVLLCVQDLDEIFDILDSQYNSGFVVTHDIVKRTLYQRCDIDTQQVNDLIRQYNQ